jgi:RES domain-containing protein
MTVPRTVTHHHVPLYRVIRRAWADPLDTSYSQRASADNRWNTPDFPALYCACSEQVARAVARDVYRLAGVESADLQDAMLPDLVEITWAGGVVDIASSEGVQAAGFPPEYPFGIEKTQTRERATAWYDNGAEGVVGRSTSLMRLGFSNWVGEHESWCEVTIFVNNSRQQPSVQRRRTDLDWLTPTADR